MKSFASNEIRDYFKILKEDPSSRVFAPLAEALVRRGRLDEAEKICQMGLEAHPDFSDGHLAYARVLYYLFRYQEALQQVKLTLATTPDKVEAYLIAAEIFLARSQHKPASDACLKAIDIDPENVEARQILRRINAQADEGRAGKTADSPRRESTSRYRAQAGTAPSRRVQESQEPASPSDPFRQLLQETGREGTGRIERVEQPFSALSAGSYPADDREFGEADDFEVEEETAVSEKRQDHPEDWRDDRVMGLKKLRRDGTPIPALPARPSPDPSAPDQPGPDDLLAQVAAPAGEGDTSPQFEAPAEDLPPAGPSGQSFPGLESPGDSELPGVESVQSLIDAYSMRSSGEVYDSTPVKVPRSGRLLAILFVLGSAAAIAGLLVLGFSRDRTPPPSGGKQAATAGQASSAPLDQVPEPTAPPQGKPEDGGLFGEADGGPASGETSPAEPEKTGKAAAPSPNRSRRKKTYRRRRRRRRKRLRVRRKRKRRKRTRR